jgi:hypothetical protein
VPKKVSKYILASLAVRLCSPPDEEWLKLERLSASDTETLEKLVRVHLVPQFKSLDASSQQKIRDSLEYYVGISTSGIERLFPSFQIPLAPELARDFFRLAWNVLFDSPFPKSVHSDDYEEVNDSSFVNSLTAKDIPVNR